MANVKRKEKLRDRAYQYAKYHNKTQLTSVTEEIASAFMDGYRAAMRDARASFKNERTDPWRLRRLLQFLRPLR